MTACCTLETEGYRVTFHLKDLAQATEYVDGWVELSLQPGLGDFVLRSQPTFLGASDLRQLASYFEGHITRLKEDPDTASPVFVPLELGFQVQALCGEVSADEEGEFTVRFLLNVGQREGCARTYAGAEAVVDVRNVREFTASLDAMLARRSPRHEVDRPSLLGKGDGPCWP